MSFGQDLRYATRTLTNSRGFTLVAVLTLAIGVGANVAIFSFVDGILLKPLPYDQPERIVRMLEKPPQGERNGISTLNFLDWQRDNTVFDFHSAQTGGNVTMTGGSEPIQLRGARVSAALLQRLPHQARARPGVPARRGSARQAPGGRHQPRPVGEPVRFRSQHHQSRRSARRPAAYHRRRAARGQRLRSRRGADLAAARVSALEHDARLPLAHVVRAAQGRRHARSRRRRA